MSKEEPSVDVSNRGNCHSSVSVGPVSSVLPAVQTSSGKSNLPKGVSTSCGLSSKVKLKVESHWYALRCTYGREKLAFEYLQDKGMKTFYPTIISQSIKDGVELQVEKSRLPNILFAYGELDQLKEHVYDNVHKETQHLRFYYNQHHDGTKEPLVIPEKQMQSLMLICNSGSKDIILEPLVLNKFSEGQHVMITDGPFAGVEGTVARFKGQQRVGVVIEGLLTMVTAYVPTAFLKQIDLPNV